MDLKDFIKETLIEIASALSEADKELTSIDAVVNPKNVIVAGGDGHSIYGYLAKDSENRDQRRPVHIVEFDVSVTATDKTGTKGGIGVMVAGIGLGSQGQSEAANSVYSRLQFKVPIAFPVGKKT
jgi:hypothetical protein